MSHVRLVLGYLVVAFLTLGYLFSQYAYLYGDPTAYSRAVDVPSVKWLCFFLLAAAVILAVVPAKEEE
jgi:hypothetical protein